MDDGPALLATILANPDDDTPRLVYADVIEGRDPARAEFIRVQIELARTPEFLISKGQITARNENGQFVPYDPNTPGRDVAVGVAAVALSNPRYDALRRREWDLHTGGWADWWPQAMDAIRPVYRRGFPHAVTCPWLEWAEHADPLLAREPVRAVTITTAPEYRFVGWSADGETGEWDVAGGPALLAYGEWVRGRADTLPEMILRARWPRVARGGWTLPPPRWNVESWPMMTPDFRERLERDAQAISAFDRQLRDDIIRSLGIPPQFLHTGPA